MDPKTLILGGIAAFALYKLFGTSTASAQEGPVLGPSPGDSNSTYTPPTAFTNPATGAAQQSNGTYTLLDGRNLASADYFALVADALSHGLAVYTKLPDGSYRQWLKISGNTTSWRDITQADYVKILRRAM